MNTNPNKIKQLRLSTGKTQYEVASETGISLRTIKRYENGKIIGYSMYLYKLAQYYNVSTDELIDDKYKQEE